MNIPIGENYWCDRCEKFVLPLVSLFNHPEFTKPDSCFVCPDCDYMVYLKKTYNEDDYVEAIID